MRLIGAAGIFIGVLLFTYLAFAFCMWKINPGEWGETLRFIAVWFGICAGAVMVPMAFQ